MPAKKKMAAKKPAPKGEGAKATYLEARKTLEVKYQELLVEANDCRCAGDQAGYNAAMDEAHQVRTQMLELDASQ